MSAGYTQGEQGLFTSTPGRGLSPQMPVGYNTMSPQPLGMTIGAGRVRVATLGDSRTAQGRAGAPGSTANSWYAHSPNTWLRCLSGQRYFFAYNGGVSGDKTFQVNKRIPAALATQPQLCIYWAGCNNISTQTVNPDLPATYSVVDGMMADVQAAAAEFQRVGCVFLIFLDTPVTNWNATQDLQHYAFNQRLSDWAVTQPGVVLFDAHRLVMDYTSAVAGTVKTGYYSDETHGTITLGYVLGKALNSLVGNLFPNGRRRHVAGLADSFANNPLQLGVNGNFITTSGGTGSGAGGITGTIPLGISIARSGTGVSTACATAAATDPADGNAFTMTFTGAVNNDFVRIKQDIDGTSTPTIGALTRDAYYECSADIVVSGTVNLETVELYCERSDGTTSYTYRDCFGNGLGGGVPDGETYSATLLTEPMYVPAGTFTYLQWYLRAKWRGAAGAAVVSVMNKNFHQLTTLPA